MNQSDQSKAPVIRSSQPVTYESTGIFLLLREGSISVSIDFNRVLQLNILGVRSPEAFHIQYRQIMLRPSIELIRLQQQVDEMFSRVPVGLFRRGCGELHQPRL
jgi:hypothetical protein